MCSALIFLFVIYKYNDFKISILKKLDTKMDGVNVRVYSSKHSTNSHKPIMIYYHGGGFFMGVSIFRSLKAYIHTSETKIDFFNFFIFHSL